MNLTTTILVALVSVGLTVSTLYLLGRIQYYKDLYKVKSEEFQDLLIKYAFSKTEEQHAIDKLMAMRATVESISQTPIVATLHEKHSVAIAQAVITYIASMTKEWQSRELPKLN